MNTTDFCSTAL